MMKRPAVQRTCEIEQAIGYELPQKAAAEIEEGARSRRVLVACSAFAGHIIMAEIPMDAAKRWRNECPILLSN
jgi:hypothetical protein